MVFVDLTKIDLLYPGITYIADSMSVYLLIKLLICLGLILLPIRLGQSADYRGSINSLKQRQFQELISTGSLLSFQTSHLALIPTAQKVLDRSCTLGVVL